MDLPRKSGDFVAKVTDHQALEASKLRVCLAKVEGCIASESVAIPPDMEDTGPLQVSIPDIESKIWTAQADHAAHPGRTGKDYMAAVGPLKDARRQAIADLRDMEARNAARMSVAEAEYRSRVEAIATKKTDIMKDLESLYSQVTI